jgi:S1-C subfamily serine protease
MIKKAVAVIFLLFFCVSGALHAEPDASDFAAAVVALESTVKPNARTGATLGSTRSGSAVIIDASGLLVTVGYLVLEAAQVEVTFNDGSRAPAEVVVNDHATGLALLRTQLPEGMVAMALGDSSIVGIDDDAVVLPHGGTANAHVTRIARAREFAGSWEYLLDRAFYTSPATRSFSGAALINRDAELIGIGSLLLSDINADNTSPSVSGNLFIPIEHLRSGFGTLLTGGQTVEKRAWLGVTLNESIPDLKIVRVAEESPAAAAELQVNDAVLAVNSQRVYKMADLYRTLWSAGNSGSNIELLIVREGQVITTTVTTADRHDWLR